MSEDSHCHMGGSDVVNLGLIEWILSGLVGFARVS